MDSGGGRRGRDLPEGLGENAMRTTRLARHGLSRIAGGRPGRRALVSARSVRLAVCLAGVGLIAAGQTIAAARDESLDHGEGGGHSGVTVMTRNMDEGTDFGYLVGPHALPFAQAAPLTYQEVVQSGIPQRAAAVADEIATTRPDLVALQEAARWQGPSLTQPGATLTLDALASLESRLAADGAPYHEVAVVPEMAIAASLGPGATVSFLDRDVILARDASSDEDGGLRTANVQTGHFAVQLSVTIPGVGPISITRGWASVDLSRDDQRARFIATHLESIAQPIQAAQAQELASGPAATRLPVILAGDFNTGPNVNPPPVGTTMLATYTTLTTTDHFVDSWAAVHPHLPGFTDSLYTEDPFTLATPTERIDLVLVRGRARPVRAQQVGTSMVGALFPSDHIGVVARVAVGGSDD